MLWNNFSVKIGKKNPYKNSFCNATKIYILIKILLVTPDIYMIFFVVVVAIA